MSENTVPSVLSDETDGRIPTREEIDEVIEENVTTKKYNDYYQPYLAFLLDPERDGSVTAEDVYEQARADVKEDTKKAYLKDVFEFHPPLSKAVVDLNPSAEAFLDYAIEDAEISIEPETINEAKDACEELSDEFYDLYIEHHLNRLIHETEAQIEWSIPEEGEIRIGRHQEFVKEMAKIIGQKLPDELVTFNQSITSVGGRSNEKITIRSLEAAGMQEGLEFENISSGGGNDNGDLKVYSKASDVRPLEVEIKSTSNRERGGAGLARVDDPSILFGYFDDQTELAGSAGELRSESIAVYAPPETLAEMASENPDKYEQETSSPHTNSDGEWLFFRANVVFADDMHHYYETGRLPDRELGHENRYL